MTQILKLEGDHGATVRSLDVQQTARLPTPEERRVAALEIENENLRQSLLDAETTRLTDTEAAYNKGRSDAAIAFKRAEEQALSALQGGITGALTKLDEHFADAERFGLTLALAALEKVVAEPTHYKELIATCILKQVGGLRHDTILSIVVSAEDFTDQVSLANLAAASGASAIVTASPLLSAGECRIELRLGAIDISLREFWTKLEARSRSLLKGHAP